MKQNIFKLSFITYTLALLALPFVTAKLWADALAILLLIAVGYEVVYVVRMRSRKVIAQYFVYALLALELWVLSCGVQLAVNGYVPTDIVGYPIGERVYGWAAVTGDFWQFLLFIGIVLVATIVQIAYALTSSKNKV